MPMDGADHLRGRLDGIKARLRDQTPAMRLIGEEIVLRVSNAFRDSRSPAGEDWPELAPSTLKARAAKLPGARKRGKGGRLTAGAKRARGSAGRLAGLGVSRGMLNSAFKPLIDTGRLRGSAGQYKAGPRSVRWSAVGYGGPHMTGTGRIPRRNFAPFVRVGGHWAPIPSLAQYARGAVSRYVITGALR